MKNCKTTPSNNVTQLPLIFQPLVAVLWSGSTAVALAIVYGLVPYIDENKVEKIDDLTRVAYGSLSRFAWAVSISWVIFACIKGYGGTFNSI